MKKFKKVIILFFSVFLFSSFFSINKIFAISNYDSLYYVNEQEEKLNISQRDEIVNYGQLLSLRGIDLIINTKIQNNKSGNEECKDIFYNYMKKSEDANKVIVAIYYTDNKEFQIYDDYGVLTSKTINDIHSYLKKFHSNDKLDEGLVFAYKTLSKEINDNFQLQIVQLKELEIINPYKQSIFSIKNFIGIIIIFVLLFGFRRNKNMSMT